MKIPRLPFNFPKIGKVSGMLNFGKREKVIAASIFTVTLVLAVVITIIVMSSKRGNDVTAVNYRPPELGKGSVSVLERPFLSDFIIYENKLQESFTGVIYSREPGEPWEEEMIEKYWIDPQKIALEHLEQEAEKIIKDIFADVP